MAEIFKPTRAEQFFESIPEFDVTKFVITHRWANYLDDVGEEINATAATNTDSLIALEATTGRLQGITKNTENQVEDLTQFIADLSRSRAEIRNLENNLSDLTQFTANLNRSKGEIKNLENGLADLNQFISELIAQDSLLRAQLSTLRQRIEDLEALNAN